VPLDTRRLARHYLGCFVFTLRPRQRFPQIGVLTFEPVEPRRLIRSRQMRFRVFGEREKPRTTETPFNLVFEARP
jgi:hypothetical protein